MRRRGPGPGAAPRAGIERQVAAALARASLYQLLARAFGYPAVPTLAELGTRARQVLTLPETPDLLGGALRAFVAAVDEADPDALAEEHVFLFDRQVRCPPYEGAYGDTPSLAGKSATLADLGGFYLAFGLEPAATQPDVLDHVATELSFMGALALKEAMALADGHAEGLAVTRDAQEKFLRDHLGRWADAFAARLRGTTPLRYYVALADLLSATIGGEIERHGLAPVKVTEAVADPVCEEEAFTCPMAAAPAGPGPGP